MLDFVNVLETEVYVYSAFIFTLPLSQLGVLTSQALSS